MKKPISFPFVATLLLLAGTRLAIVFAERRIPEQLAEPLDRIGSTISEWTLTETGELSKGVLRELEPTSYLARTYQKQNLRLDLFVAFYAQQRAGESMHSPKHCLPGGGWEIWKHGSASVPWDGGYAAINKYSIQNSGQRMLMFYWYQSRDRIIASEYVGKFLLARDALFSGRTAASIVRITLPDVPGADKEGVAFAAEVVPQVQRCFGKRPGGE